MDWLSKKYDRIFLLIACIAALVFSVLMIINSNAFKNRFAQPRPDHGEDRGDPGTKSVNEVSTALGEQNIWNPTTMGPKLIPLFVSVPLVEKNGKMIDLSTDDELLRAPIPNTWLLDNGVHFLRADCHELDPDKDGFTNIQEWKGKTDPQDPAAHPPLTDKLVMVEKVEIPYTLVFNGAIEPQFQVQRVEPDRRSWFVERGGSFEEGRFTVVDYTKKEVDDENLGKRDASELLVKDNLWDENIVLVKREKKNLPTQFAIFEYRRLGRDEFQVKKGDVFRLPNDDTSSYKLTSVTEEGAEIVKVGGAEGDSEAIKIPFSN